MCGIAGGFVKAEGLIRQELKAIYNNQKERGTHGAGISIMRQNGDIFRTRDFSPKKLLAHSCFNTMRQGTLFIFHHRLPTSTQNLPESNHPICNEDQKIHLIHNGMVSGYEGIGEDLEKKGHKLETKVISKELYETSTGRKYILEKGEDFNDSEVIVHMLEENFKESWEEALKKTVVNLMGSIALAFMVQGEPRIYLYCGYNPICVYRDGFGNILFSSVFPEKTKYKFRPIKEMSISEMGIIENGEYKSLGQIRSRDYYSHGAYGYEDPEQLEFDDAFPWDRDRNWY